MVFSDVLIGGTCYIWGKKQQNAKNGQKIVGGFILMRLSVFYTYQYGYVHGRLDCLKDNRVNSFLLRNQ